MSARTKILFKINNEIVVEESGDLFPNQIDEMKWVIASECQCSIDEVTHEIVEIPQELSEDIDVSTSGMVFWKSLEHKTVQGVYCELKQGSDEYLDAVSNGTIDEYLHFFI